MSRGYDGGYGGGYGGEGRPERGTGCSLLVRNLSKYARPDDLRYSAEKYGPVRDVYIPRDFHTKESRGIGFIEYHNPRDAEEAVYGLDRKVIEGKEISVVIALQGRKRPDHYRSYDQGFESYRGGGYRGSRDRDRDRDRDRSRDRSWSRGHSRGRRSSRRSYTPSRSPSRSFSPRSRSRSASRTPPPDRRREEEPAREGGSHERR